MNQVIRNDIIWKAYFCLPHCVYNRRKNKKRLTSKFNYSKDKDISIISVNCVGGILYSLLGLPFSSPFINTSMDRKEFILMTTHFKDYMTCKMKIKEGDDGVYEGLLGSADLPLVRIRFPHDDDPDEILKKWDRRKHRINYDKLVFLCDDRGIKAEHLKLYDQVSCYKKILFTAHDYSGKYEWCHQLKVYEDQKCVGKYNEKSRKGGWVFEYIWDFADFMNS